MGQPTGRPGPSRGRPRRRWRPREITVSADCPGVVDRDMWVTVDRETARHTGRPGRHIRAQFVEPIASAGPTHQASLSTATDLAWSGGSAHGGDRFPETRRHRAPVRHVLPSVGPARQRPWRAWAGGRSGKRQILSQLYHCLQHRETRTGHSRRGFHRLGVADDSAPGDPHASPGHPRVEPLASTAGVDRNSDTILGMPLLTPRVVAAETFSSGTQPTILTGNGLVLRPWKPSDAPAVFEAFADPEIQRWHVRAAASRGEVETWINSWVADWAADPSALGCHRLADRRFGRQGSLKNTVLVCGQGEVAYWTMPRRRNRTSRPGR